jgi:hypothetical protein
MYIVAQTDKDVQIIWAILATYRYSSSMYTFQFDQRSYAPWSMLANLFRHSMYASFDV